MLAFATRAAARHAVLVAVVAAGLLGLSSPVAQAAAFGQPVTISGKDDATSPSIAIAPSGRTAVVYGRYPASPRAARLVRAAIGPAPDRLAAARPVPLGSLKLDEAYEFGPVLTLLARPDGGFVLCFPSLVAGRQRAQGCSVAGPDGVFGRPSIVRTVGRGDAATLSAVVRPDSSTVLVLDRSVGTTRQLATAVLRSDGSFTPPAPVARTETEPALAYATAPSLGVAADGTVALSTPVQRPGSDRYLHPAIRTMAPGADTFGPVTVLGDDQIESPVQIRSGLELLIGYVTRSADGGEATPHLLRRSPDGTIAPALPATELPTIDVFHDFGSSASTVLPAEDCSACTGSHGAIRATPTASTSRPAASTRSRPDRGRVRHA